MIAFVAFVLVERTAENPVVPFSLFFDRNRLAMFAAMFLVRGIGFTVTVLLAMYVQNIMGYSPLRAAIGFIPFAVAMTIGTVVSSRLVTWFSPRVVVIAGGIVVLGATLYGSTLSTSQLWGMIGVTPMIGVNDQSDEVFGFSDAKQLLAFAEKMGLGEIAMWSLGRDQEDPAGAIRDFDGGSSQITLVSDEPAYSRMVLPYYLANRIPEKQVYTADDAYYDRLKVERKIGRLATKIDPKANTVTLDDGQTLPFDNLLIATGSSATIPPVPGADLPDPSRRGLHAAFLGIALSISALPVIAKTLLDLGLMKTDLGLVIRPEHWDIHFTEYYLCYQKIYSERHRQNRPLRAERISEDHPLRCVFFNESPEGSPLFQAWMAEMSRSFVYRGSRDYTVTGVGPRGPDFANQYRVYEFVPRPGAVALGVPSARGLEGRLH